jgi:hypothetical protein
MRLRPLTEAQRGIVVTLLALGLAALLNAHGLRKLAVIQPEGVRRDVALDVTAQLVRTSEVVRLDRPRHALKAALGRELDDRIDTTIDLTPVVEAAPRAPRSPPPATTESVETDPGGPAPAALKPARPAAPARPAFSPKRPLRLWVAGDSLVAVPGGSIERAVPSGGAIRIVGVESRVATGLGRPDVYNWYARFREVIRELRPHVVVLSFGSNDGHDFLSGVPEGTTIGALGSPSWLGEYRRRIEGVTHQFHAAGAHVVWLGLPKTRGEGRNRGFRVVNSVLRAVAASNPEEGEYVDTWRLFTNRFRSYVDYQRNDEGKLVRMRGADGVHYAPAAGDVLARHLLGLLHERYDLMSWRRRAAG